MIQNQIVGAIKIKDGLFIGDEYASQDREFIITNKVTHIINCAGQEVQNKWTLMGAKYLTFNWLEQDNEVLFDERGENVNKIFTFIEDCNQLGESCLVHSVRGQSRACCVLAAYFMKKYSWTLYKTLEYLNSRRPDLEIRASFFYQLNALENRMNKQGPKRTASWNELTTDEQNPQQVQEELIIRNTFLNSHNGPVDEIYTNLQAKQGVQGKVTNQKLKWKDQINQDNIQLATLVYSGSPDFVPVSEINLKRDPTTPPILKGAQKPQITQQPPKQPQIQSNFPKSTQSTNTAQVRSASSKSQQQDQNELTVNSNITSANLTNNPSFQNLLMHCAMKTRTPQQQSNNQNQVQQNLDPNNINAKKTPTINNLVKPPLDQAALQQQQTNIQNNVAQLNSATGIRSNSLQQDEKKQQADSGNNRPNSVKQKETAQQQQPSILTNFQEFKNQVQQSLNYFNKQSEAILNMDKQSIQSQTTQLTNQTNNLSNPSQTNQLNNQINPQLQTNQQKSKLDQLISPTLIQSMNSTKHSEIQKTLTQSISQLQSSYQKFQQLQQKNQIKQSQSQACIQKPSVQNVEVSQITNQTLLNLKAQERSTSLTKNENQDQKNRPNSAENKDARGNSQSKKDSLSPFQKEPVKKSSQQGPPLPQSSSQIYLRNVQCRRQAASTLRNQQKPNNSFQDKYLNQSANQVQNNSSFNNNSNSAIEADQKQSTKGIVTDLNQFKKLISPQNLTKSQAQFVKNQPIRVLQELTEKTQSQKQVQDYLQQLKSKAKDNVSSTSFTLVSKPSTANTRTFSPAIKTDSKSKASNQSNVRHKIRNSSPGIQKEQDSSNSLQNISATLQGKNSWKML